MTAIKRHSKCEHMHISNKMMALSLVRLFDDMSDKIVSACVDCVKISNSL